MAINYSLNSKETCALIQQLADTQQVRNIELANLLKEFDTGLIVNDEQNHQLVDKMLEIREMTDTAIAILNKDYCSIYIPPPDNLVKKMMAKRLANRAKRKAKKKK